MRGRKDGFFAFTLVVMDEHATREDAIKAKETLLRGLKREAKRKNYHYLLFGCLTREHVSKNQFYEFGITSKGNWHLHLTLYGDTASSIKNFIIRRWHKHNADKSSYSAKRVYNLDSWIDYTYKNYIRDDLAQWICQTNWDGAYRMKRGDVIGEIQKQWTNYNGTETAVD